MIKKINHYVGTFLARSFLSQYLKKRLKFLKYKDLLIENDNLESYVFGSIFFRFYEKAEIFFLKKYFEPITTIDIGSGLGILSGILRKNNKKKNFMSILVEANKKNIDFSKKLFKQNKIYRNTNFLNYAFSGSSKKNFYFDFRNTLDSKITRSKKKKSKIKIIRFNDIKKRFSFKNFQIILDIEGEEFNLDSKSLKNFDNCKRAIIEIHSRSQNKQNKLISRIHKYSKLRFKEKKNFVFYFEK